VLSPTSAIAACASVRVALGWPMCLTSVRTVAPYDLSSLVLRPGFDTCSHCHVILDYQQETSLTFILSDIRSSDR